MAVKKAKFKQTEIGKIPQDWETADFSQVAEIISGGTPKTANEEYWNGEIPWLSVVDFNTGQRRVFITEKSITKKGLDNSATQILHKGEIIISARGTVGVVAQLGKDMAFNQSCYGLRAKRETTNDFLYYSLKFRVNSLKQSAHGSVFETITRSSFDLLKLALPPLPEQRAISKILSDLDDKIELNNQINKTLEAIGQAIFKHWFVDFEFPNEQGKPYKSSGGKIVDSELGKIPNGWKIGRIVDEFDLTMGQSPPGKSYNEIGEGVVFFQGRTDFGFRYPTVRMFCTSPTRFAKEGDTLVSVRAPVGDINMSSEKCCIGRGLAAIRHKTGSRSYTYYSLSKLRDKFDYFEAEGTVFGSISKTDFENLTVSIPSISLIGMFENTLFSIDQKIEINTFNISVLAKIRDSLLPKLMSGKIRVPYE